MADPVATNSNHFTHLGKGQDHLMPNRPSLPKARPQNQRAKSPWDVLRGYLQELELKQKDGGKRIKLSPACLFLGHLYKS